MSLKVLVFGHPPTATHLIQSLSPSFQPSSDSPVSVITTNIYERTFLLFFITQRQLIGEQAAGCNALLFCYDSTVPVYEEKEFLLNLLGERREFEGIPLILAYMKDPTVTIKEVVSSFELFKIKDRASMIKEVSHEDTNSVPDIFGWIVSHLIQTTTFSANRLRPFDAQPKVVKVKAKFREDEPENSELKYEAMVRDKQVKGLPVREQEKTYVDREKERIKQENMEKQLTNFKNNKKKMSPYDIKATPNPKIEANLHFFLKDPHTEKPAQVSIKLQTDQFKPKKKEPTYVLKKTGVNLATQIEHNELFNFDVEVVPILKILTSKALEVAALEIEEEQEFLKIAKYKNAYQEKLEKQHQHEQAQIEEERLRIKQKDKVLEAHMKRHQAKQQLQKKINCYKLSAAFVASLFPVCQHELLSQNVYVDSFMNELHSGYIDHLLAAAGRSYEKLLEKQKVVKGVFDSSIVDPLLKKSHGSTIAQKEKMNQIKGRRANQEGQVSFTKFLDKALDNTLDEVLRVREEQIKEIKDKAAALDQQDQAVQQFKDQENSNFGKDHVSFQIETGPLLCFSVAANRYAKTSKCPIEIRVMAFNKENEEVLRWDQSTSSSLPWLSIANNLRSSRDLIGMENGVILRTNQLPQNFKNIILTCVIHRIDTIQQKDLTYASYGIQFYDRAITIDREDFGEKLKWEQLVGKSAGGEGEENQSPAAELSVVMASYRIAKMQEYLYLEKIGSQPRAVGPTALADHLDSISRFVQRSVEVLRDEQEEEEPQQSGKKSSSRTQKRTSRSKRKIDEVAPVQVKKKQAVLMSKIFNEVTIPLNPNAPKAQGSPGSVLSSPLDLLADSVKDYKQLIESCDNGWVMNFDGKQLKELEQLRGYSKVKQLQVFRVEKKPEEEQIIAGDIPEKAGEEED